ncbi:hypothetical protein POV27_03265 [Aureisphaera galaxeae]|uniref:hypothetical protein n=1 Tax=Aureisphaera galaxeae TaxID=1538023 RepID=UPI0023500548|nr:hypothetical protein [Aureisphaera galaxeae]MDC8003053.1 hypothetical protein [Aureisphaera galaxeae]
MRPAFNVGHILYYQLNIDYIIETYCINKEAPELQCNGKCFLSKQLEKADDNQKEETAQLAIIEAFFPQYFEKASPIQIKHIFFLYRENNWKELDLYTSLSIPIWGPPPKVS